MPTPSLDLDTRLLSEFIYALNIARRQVASYPPGHPMIASAAEKLLFLVEKLLEFRKELTIGIARDTLLVDDKQLDPSNPVYRDLASSLFKAKVASLTVSSQATVDEVRLFFEALASPAHQFEAAGGLSALLLSRGVRGFRAQEIDYRAFHATEVDSLSAPKISGLNEESAVLWKAFASGVVSGTIDPDGIRQLPGEQFDPVLLAEALNREEASGKIKANESYEHAIADFIKRSASQQYDIGTRQDLFGRLGKLIEQLSPELRRRMLNSTLQGLSATPESAGEMLANWSHDTLVEAFEQAETGRLQVPQILLDILGKLGAQQESAEGRRPATTSGGRQREQTAALLGRLFHDGTLESYVPKDYADALSVLASANVMTNLAAAQVEELLDSLNGHALERHYCTITLELLEQDVERSSLDAIRRNLDELVPYFLETGDFQSLLGIHDQLLQHGKAPNSPRSSAAQEVLGIFASEQFTAQVLDGLDEWGKDQYPAIRELIGKIGVSFADPLLDRLAEEPLMARRRLYMECLQQIGPLVSAFIVGRLHDARWYVVRNLVVLLREMNDVEALRPLSRLSSHPHPKIQYEVMRTFLHFNDPRADQYLLRELNRPDVSFLAGIARLAASSRNPDVAVRLAEMLNSRGNSEAELKLKQTIIGSLAEMGCVQALPGLGSFIENRSLFMSKGLTQLKVEAAASLGRYPASEAAALVAGLRRRSSGEIALALEKVRFGQEGTTS